MKAISTLCLLCVLLTPINAYSDDNACEDSWKSASVTPKDQCIDVKVINAKMQISNYCNTRALLLDFPRECAGVCDEAYDKGYSKYLPIGTESLNLYFNEERHTSTFTITLGEENNSDKVTAFEEDKSTIYTVYGTTTCEGLPPKQPTTSESTACQTSPNNTANYLPWLFLWISLFSVRRKRANTRCPTTR